MNVNRIPLFLMLHRIIESNNQIKSDYDIKFSNFELIAKSIYEINNNLKKKNLTIIPTFDDGNKSDLICARLLNKYKIKGIFFIIINKINEPEYLTKNDLLEIKELGHHIGSHTMSHLTCPTSNSEVVFKELCNSKTYLEELLKNECEHFAFPGGLYNSRDFILAKKAGYKYIFNTFEKLPSSLNADKPISRMHIRQSTLKTISSIFELKKSYYLMRFFRSYLRNLKYKFKIIK